MSKENNVKLVQSTKEVLNQMGIEIKTTQVYEFYSKLIGYNNWNIAKSRNVDFLNKVIYENYSLEDLVLNHSKLSLELIVNEIHKRMNHKIIENFDPKRNRFGISQIICWNNDIKVAIMTRNYANGEKITEKHIGRLKKAMDFYGCAHGLLYTSATDLPNNLCKKSFELGIEIVDYEDLLRQALIVDELKNK